MTAIAAVLALSSTPLAAQDATSTEPPLVEAPVAEPTPAPATEPAADPLAPEPAANSSMPAETVAEVAPAPKPVAKKAATKTVRTAERSAPRAAAPTAPAQPETAAEPVGVAPVALPMAAAEAPPEAAPAAPEPQQDAQLDEALPVAGGAGALILALAGAGMAVRRRKRRDADEMDLDRQSYAENTDAALMPIEAEASAPEWSEPVIQPKPAPAIPAKMETAEVSDDFDTSRFGRHVQAAYRGPTPGNPSLSLRKRLKLAGELDRRERMHGTVPRNSSSKPVTTSLPANEKPVMAFAGSASQAKWPEYQL